jgi:porin
MAGSAGMEAEATGKRPLGTSLMESDIHGMTANGFMSASLSPPLCVVSIGTTASSRGWVAAIAVSRKSRTPERRGDAPPRWRLRAEAVGVTIWQAAAVRTEVGAMVVAVLVLGTTDARAQDDGWFERDAATGGWGGARQRLVEVGVAPQARYTTDLLANPIGGAKQGFAYAGELEASLEFDLERLLGLKGSSFLVAASWASGRDLSERKIDNLFTVSQIFNGQSVRLAQMYFEQKLLEERLSLAIGRLTTGDDFATSDLFENYVSAGVNGNPFSLPLNAPSFSSAPIASWGVRAIVEPSERLRLAAGVYNADPKVGEDDQNGIDFVLNPEDGVLVIAEAGYRHGQEDGDAGLPGTLKIGGYCDSSEFESFSDPGDERKGNCGLYALLDQMAYLEGGASDEQGLTPWVTLTFAPIEAVNTLPFFAAGGLVYHGLFPGRDDDTTNLGVYYGRFSDDLPDQSFETVLELNHRFQLAPWLHVSPDLQYVFRPNGSDDEPDAAVVGAEVGLDF